MTDDSAAKTQRAGLAKPPSAGEGAVWTAMGVCLVLALVALVVGLSMAASKRVAPCANGTFFPEGTKNFDCYIHPQAGTGTVIAIFAVMLGVIVVLSAISAAAVVRSHTTSA